MNKHRLIAVAILIGFNLVQGALIAADTGEVIQEMPGGQVNWTRGWVATTGVESPREKNQGKIVDGQLTLSKAKVDAHHKLFETIKAIKVDTWRSVGETIAHSNIITAKVQDLIKNTPIAKQEYLSDGTVNLTLQMSLYGGFLQLVLPADIRQIESIKPVTSTRKESSTASETASAPGSEAPAKTVYTGLVVDAMQLDINPALVLTIFVENGPEVYGSAFASREFAVQHGTSCYLNDMAAALDHQRVGPRPLVIKALATGGEGKSDLIISASDASKVLGASEHLSFLRECRVIVVTQ